MVKQVRLEFDFKVFVVYLAINVILNSYTALGSLWCDREQTSLINQEKVLDCTITGRYYGVYWYIGESRDPVIRFINGHKAGSEYQRGKLDIASNGSMIIKNVSVNDERTYRVMVVWREGGDDNAYVHLTVIVPGSRDIPEIDRCNDTSESCRLCIYQSVFLECSMDGRPPVDLKWFDASSEIPAVNINISESSPLATFISTSKVKVQLDHPEIKEIACVPSGPAVTLPGRNVRNASFLLISPSDPYVSYKETHYLPISNLSQAIGHNTSKTVAWIKQTLDLDYSFEIPTCKALDWSGNGKFNLQLNSDFEGIYTQVVKKNVNTFERNVYEIRQAIAPKQFHFIEECLSQDPQNCTVYVNGIGTLNCSAIDSKPADAITWKVAQSGPQITQLDSIRSCEHGIRKCKTTVKITFRFTSTKVDFGELECLVSGPWYNNTLSSSVKVINNRNQLLTSTQPEDKNAEKGKKIRTAVIAVSCVIILLLFIVLIIFIRKKSIVENAAYSSKKGEVNIMNVLDGETNVGSTSEFT